MNYARIDKMKYIAGWRQYAEEIYAITYCTRIGNKQTVIS